MEDIEKKDKRTILVVDDEKPIVEILVYNLQKEGYDTLYNVTNSGWINSLQKNKTYTKCTNNNVISKG